MDIESDGAGEPPLGFLRASCISRACPTEVSVRDAEVVLEVPDVPAIRRCRRLTRRNESQLDGTTARPRVA